MSKIKFNSDKAQIQSSYKSPAFWLFQLSDEIVCRRALNMNPNILGLKHFDEIDEKGAKCISNCLRILSGVNTVQRKEWLPIQIGLFLEHILNETDQNGKLSIYSCHDVTSEFINTSSENR